MADVLQEGRTPARSLPEALVRTLRHEVGDLLQKVYASVAILKDRQAIVGGALVQKFVPAGRFLPTLVQVAPPSAER